MRLIDADKLMEYCQNLKERKIDCNDIARFPTAYDVNKVLEDLRTAREDYDNEGDYDVSFGIRLAIEIVKDGGENCQTKGL